MDLSKPISYNSLTVNGLLSTIAGGAAMSGYRVDEMNVSSVDVAQRLDKRAVTDGIDAQDIYLGGRHINGIVSVFGSTTGDFWDKAQDLLSAFSPTLAYSADSANLGFLPFDFYQPTADIVTWPLSAYPSGIPLRYYCRPFAPPSFDIDRDNTGGVATKGLAKRFRISLLARSPNKVVQDEKTVSHGLTTTAVHPTGTYRGDYPSAGTVTIVSTTTTGTLQYTIAGSTLSLRIDTAPATYVLDLVAKTLKRNGTLAMDLILNSYDFTPFGPTAADIARNTISSCQTSASAVYREAFA